MSTFEFALEGPPVSLNAKNHKSSLKRYNKWIKTVHAAAKASWPPGDKPTAGDVAVTIANYYTAAPPDVDNIIKPILDGLNKLVYLDDKQVYTVTCERIDLSSAEISSPSAVLVNAITKWSEIIYIRVTWQGEEDGDSETVRVR